MALSVLLVDDNPHFLRVLDRFLATFGDDAVRVVGSVVGGRDAVAQAAWLRPDVILLDLKMPDVPGLQLLPELRRMLPEAILVALTLMESDEFREDALAAGADAFVSKASLESDLIPAIQRLAARAPRYTPAPDPEREVRDSVRWKTHEPVRDREEGHGTDVNPAWPNER
jgi:DNA-binding NarL/FixJ family response regulator